MSIYRIDPRNWKIMFGLYSPSSYQSIVAGDTLCIKNLDKFNLIGHDSLGLNHFLLAAKSDPKLSCYFNQGLI